MAGKRRVINVSLSSDGIESAIREIKKYKSEIRGKMQQLITAMCKTGEEYAIANVTHIDTGETVNSIHGYRKGNRGVIVAGGQAIWLEFGTGVYWNGYPNNSPNPYGNDLGFKIGEFGDQHGLDQGWFFPTTDPRYEIVKHTANGDVGTGYGYTHGIKADMFMFKTIKELQRRAPELAKDVFSK